MFLCKKTMMPASYALGAVIGDISGSIYEFCGMKSKIYEFWGEYHCITDDSILTCAIYKAVSDYKKGVFGKEQLSGKLVEYVKETARAYPWGGYGGAFLGWLDSDKTEPYNSYGNGSAMRVSAAGILANSEEEALWLAEETAKITHNHPEGIKGAVVTALAVYLALHGAGKEKIYRRCSEYYDINTDIDYVRDHHIPNEICQKTVPEAITCFLASTSFEDAVRNAVSLGGDSDTLAAIAGSIAGAYYGIPFFLRKKAIRKLDKNLLHLLGVNTCIFKLLL